MTDLFDRAAARALGLGLALRPRGRSRFEPETEPPGFAIPDSEPPAQRTIKSNYDQGHFLFASRWQRRSL